MGNYDTDVDLENRNSSQTLAVELVGPNRRVLDVGCASGYLGVALQTKGCSVWGIEYDAAEADRAAQVLEHVDVADLNNVSIDTLLGDEQFDAIVFGDVLEHLLDPEAVLRSSLNVLKDDGDVVISVPNVSHGALRLALLQGNWRYTEVGLLDKTHIIFYTLENLVDLLSKVGLVATEAWATTLDIFATEVVVDPSSLPSGIVDWVREQPGSLVYQWVVKAKRGTPTGFLPEVRWAQSREVTLMLGAESARRMHELPEALELKDQHITNLENKVNTLDHNLTGLVDHLKNVDERLRQAQFDLEARAVHIRNLDAIHETLRGALADKDTHIENQASMIQGLTSANKTLASANETLDRKAIRLAKQLDDSRLSVDRIIRSTAWKIGRRITAPARVVKRWR